MNNLTALLKTVELDESHFSDWGTGESGYLQLSDVEELLQKLIVENSCVGKHGKHELVSIFSQNDGPDGVSKEVRWCSRCGAVVIDRDDGSRTFPGAAMKMRHSTLSQAVHNLTQIAP